MSESIEKGMSLALESPDKVVRSLAIRREEIRSELAKLDGFLGAYAELSSGRAITSVSVVATVGSSAPKPLRANGSVRGGQVDFGSEIVDILSKRGAPMPFEELRDAYADRHGAEPEQNIRKRLRRRDDIVRMIAGRGFWLVNSPIPEGNGVASPGMH